jgi:hypothetical protein
MYDEYGEFRGRVLINQHKWLVHYFDTLNTKPGPDNNEFHDSSTLSSTMLIVLVTFATMRQ